MYRKMKKNKKISLKLGLVLALLFSLFIGNLSVFAGTGGISPSVTTHSATIDLSIKKYVRSITRNTAWQESVIVSPNELISFSITVTSTGNQTLKDVNIINVLPKKITYVGNLKVDGVLVSGGGKGGLKIGDLLPGTTKVITFDAKVNSEEEFGIGSTNLISSTSAASGSLIKNDTAGVFVTKGIVAGAATMVATGITNNKLIDFIFLPFLATLILFLLFRKHLVVLSDWLEQRKVSVHDTVAKKKLEKIRSQLKAKGGLN